MIPFGPRRLRGSVTSCCATLLSPHRVSWLLHCLLSSCRASWLSHCLSPSSCCVTLSSSRCASLLSHRFSLSSCCAPHSASRRADWLLYCLLTRRPLVISSSCRLVVSSSRLLVLPSSRCLMVSSSCHLVILSSLLSSHCAALLSSNRAGWLLHCLSLLLSPSLLPPSPMPVSSPATLAHTANPIATVPVTVVTLSLLPLP